MKKTMLLGMSVLLCMFLLSSCAIQRPLAEGKAQNNQTYDVQYLFEHDGCKVYRFYDRGHFIYFTTSKGTVTSIENDSTKIVTIGK